MFLSSGGSLPTPPGTSHRREKENRLPEFSTPSGSRVVWAEKNDYRLLETTPLNTFSVQASGSRKPPAKSILKKTSLSVLLPIVDENEREATPEPSDPLVDLHYLDGPVSRVLAPNATLRDLIEAYSILGARIRSSVSDSIEGDASWPLFQPLRTNRDAFIAAAERDLGRALEDPLRRFINDSLEDEPVCEEISMLPSPKDSPRKKRGMTAEQVKHARDLCTTSHAVLKLLGTIFTLPAVRNLFTDAQLGTLLTAVLAIPLAQELPTPNARKTCALAIWVLQAQRLPEEVLTPAAPRIAYAIRRGLDGELGKEGKKGAVSDGLKAIHELSTCYPTVFVPVFADLLPSIFAHLIGPVMQMRAQACHALGGLALGSASLPSSSHSTHSTLAAYVADFLLTPPKLSPSKKGSPLDDPFIIRTLRATLKATDPKTAAGGPVWALCVMAHFIVLLRTKVFTEDKVMKCFAGLFAVAIRQTKSSVRGLACLVWRCMTWAYFQPVLKLPRTDQTDAESEEEVWVSEDDVEQEEHDRASMVHHFKTVTSVVDLGAGSAMVCALLGTSPAPDHLEDEETMLRLALNLLKMMAKKGGAGCRDALETLSQLVSTNNTLDRSEWHIGRLLPRSLFEPNPGLLTAEYKTLATAVRPLFSESAEMEDVRNLTKEEIGLQWVFDSVINIWKEGLRQLKSVVITDGLPEEIREIWTNVLKRRYEFLAGQGDDSAQQDLAGRAVNVLAEILLDDDFAFELEEEGGGELILPPAPSPSNGQKHQKTQPPSTSPLHVKLALKLTLVQELWNVVVDVFSDHLDNVAPHFVTFLIREEKVLVGNVDGVDEAHEQWASLCARVCFACDISELDVFWEGRQCSRKRRREWQWSTAVKSLVWNQFLKRWQFGEMQWEMGALLLTVPFRTACAWELSNEELKVWEECLDLTINKALDSGVDTVSVLDKVAAYILSDHSPTVTAGSHVADVLLSHLDLSEIRQLPSEVFEFVNDVLLTSYPPAPRDLIKSIWLLRTLTNTIAAAEQFVGTIFETIAEGVATWIIDDHEVLSAEYSPEVTHLYQTILLSAQTLPSSVKTLDTLAPMLHAAFVGAGSKHADVKASFDDFWQAKFAETSEPEDGWPEKIVMCLQVVYPSSIEPEAERLETEEVEEQLACLESEDDIARALSPEIEIDPSLLQEPFDLSPSKRAQNGTRDDPIELTTPISSPRMLTPSRPRTTSLPELSLLLQPAGTPPSSPRRQPVTPKKTPRSEARLSARGVSDKENRSPLPNITSVMERILNSAPASPSMVPAHSKKRSLPDANDHEPAVKRQRKLYSSTSGSVRFASEASPATSTSFAKPDTSTEPQLDKSASALPKRSGKRKSEFMDAVEVFTYKEVRRRTSSLTEPRPGSSSSSQVPLRRTRSATKLSAEPNLFQQISNSSKKRRRVSSGSLSSNGSRSSSPLRAVRHMVTEVAGSDDSLMLATPSKHLQSEPSSDDDPWLGQVTPHRLVSPAMRRVQDHDFSDPPSDDSILSASPTSERQARRSGAPMSSAMKTRLNAYNAHRPPLARLSLCEDI
ncbi:unnamed protein product [Somion occarium]|uniref:Telomere-associated protein Rif1 N-terminal domain-containing protein n=1 Tax=Somion occarium TaxID=3059160 RepID=A0ABP1DYF5_9APHY